MSATCPTVCGRKPRSGCYLCTECWYLLPVSQRREFNNAYRAYRRSHGSNHSGSVLHDIAVKKYREVRIRAINTAQDAMSGRNAA